MILFQIKKSLDSTCLGITVSFISLSQFYNKYMYMYKEDYSLRVDIQ